MNDTAFIYELQDPMTGRPRYVGKSQNPFERFRLHVATSHHKRNHREKWINSILEKGLVPFMELIDEVPKAEWQFWEREYIRLYRALGFDLVNQTDGGEGHVGFRPSDESRRRMSEAQSKRKHPPEVRAKISFSLRGNKNMLGKTLPTSVREKIGNHFRGKTLSAAHKEKIRESNLETARRKKYENLDKS